MNPELDVKIFSSVSLRSESLLLSSDDHAFSLNQPNNIKILRIGDIFVRSVHSPPRCFCRCVTCRWCSPTSRLFNYWLLHYQEIWLWARQGARWGLFMRPNLVHSLCAFILSLNLIYLNENISNFYKVFFFLLLLMKCSDLLKGI